MDFRRKDNLIFFRLNRGEEIIASISSIAKKEKISLGSVEAIGASDEFSIGLYSIEEKTYYSKTFKGEYEIVSLLGNISLKDGDTYLHLHISCASKDYSCVGGHLNKCRISATLEGIIRIVDLKNDREKDEETGLNILMFD